MMSFIGLTLSAAASSEPHVHKSSELVQGPIASASPVLNLAACSLCHHRMEQGKRGYFSTTYAFGVLPASPSRHSLADRYPLSYTIGHRMQRQHQLVIESGPPGILDPPLDIPDGAMTAACEWRRPYVRTRRLRMSNRR